MDSSLGALEAKGNLSTAPSLYNPGRVAERVVHFTPDEDDVRFAGFFATWGITIVPYLRRSDRGPRLLRAAVGLWRVLRAMRRERVQLARARLPYLGGLFGCLAGWLLGVPCVVSLGGDNRLAHGLSGEYPFGNRQLSRAIEVFVLRMARAVVVPNVFTRDYVLSLIGAKAAARIRVIPWRIERIRSGSVEAPPGLEPGLPIILTVGFLNLYKHSDVLYAVVERLTRSDGPRAQFVFCGDGPLRDLGKRMFAGHRNVSFPGWQQREAVNTLLRHAAIVLVPMSGFVLLEAASLGRAVVASRLEWHSELVRDGESGFLVEARDVAAWTDRIRLLLEDVPLRERLGEALLRRFEADYGPERAEKAEIDLYCELAGGSAA